VRDGCVGGKCPPPAQGDEHNAQQMATFSTIGFAVGLAGVAGGLITLFMPPSASDAAAASTGPGGLRAHLEVGPAYLGVSGDL
jgi:hypothetical protein